MNQTAKVIACFGKSTMDKDSAEYDLCKDIGRMLVLNGHTVIHGGYKGGSMEAVSKGAQEIIERKGLSERRDSGVAMVDFDNNWERTAKTYFVKTCKTLSDRVGTLIDTADAYVILPEGGFGTMLEFVHAIHQNELNNNKGESLKPIYVMDTRWIRLMNKMLCELNVPKNAISIQYVATATELSNVLNTHLLF
jgi:predicted Rossmann-fold nucleotide-binding protein